MRPRVTFDRVPSRLPFLLLLAALSARGEPSRNLDYAESSDRRVYAFVFGHRDTCRVIRRPVVPQKSFDEYARRPPGPDWRGGPGEAQIAEFDFGRQGRPVHLVPSNDGRYLVAFANRAADGSRPAQDRIWHLQEKDYSEVLDYAALPAESPPAWPKLERGLREAKPVEDPGAAGSSYAFAVTEGAPGRLLIGRRSEGEAGRIREIVCFALTLPDAKVGLPSEAELTSLLESDETLLRAGAAWLLGRSGDRAHAAALKRAAAATDHGPSRARIAEALARCGDSAGHRALRSLLSDEQDAPTREAALLGILGLEPDRADAEPLVGALVAASDDRMVLLHALALARLESAGVAALVRTSRSPRSEVRARAARALGGFDEANAEKRLLTLVRDTEEQVAKAAATALTAPPRRLLEEHHDEFAAALEACGRNRNTYAARRLSVLAAHARIDHPRVLEALVGLAPLEESAIWALGKLTGQGLETPEDCARWWKERGKKE